MKHYFLFLAIGLLLLSWGLASAQDSVTVTTDGTWGDGTRVLPGAEVTWTIHFNVATGNIYGASNGFEVFVADTPGTIAGNYSFTTPVSNQLRDMSDWWNGGFFFSGYSLDGFGADSTKFGGFAISSPGVPIGSHDMYTITTSVDVSAVGKYLCLDSCFCPPGAQWLWCTSAGDVFPAWDGPHCYLVEPVDSVTLSDVSGVYYAGTGVLPGIDVTWTIHFDVATSNINGATNGFEVFVADAPGTVAGDYSFTIPTFTALNDMSAWWDGHFGIGEYSLDGFGADSIKFGGFSISSPGVPIGQHDMYTITTGVDASLMGKYLCIDSAWCPPGGYWLWATSSGDVFPAWDGPHCYEVVKCCQIKGDIDLNGSVPNVADLTRLVGILFRTAELPPCLEIADLDGNGTYNISDLTYFVAYLFNGGPAPVPCE